MVTQVCLSHAATSLKVVPKKVNMGVIRADDYETGYIEKIRGNLLLIKDTNNDWKVMIKTNDDNMGVIGSYTKPISDVYWKSEGVYATQLVYTNIDTYDIEVARGPRGSQEKVFVYYKILLSWAQDVPGDYNLTVVYTLTTQ